MSTTKKVILYFVVMLGIFFTTNSCKKGPQKTEPLDQIVIRLYAEPTSLSPILSRRSIDRDVHEFMFISLGDYHPTSLEIVPVLLESIPIGQIITEGPYKGSKAYKMKIKSDAAWSNGNPITGHDIAWTFKMAFHPDVIAPNWKQLLQDVAAIEVDKSDPKQMTMYVSGDYFLTFEGLLSAEIYPRHLYDPSYILDQYKLDELQKEGFSKTDKAQDSSFVQLAKDFSSTKHLQQEVHGAGPYELEKWETGQYITLKKKDNYWGDSYPNNPLLNSNYNRIIYQIIPDETVALTLLKNDEIDYLDMQRHPYIVYDDLKKDETDEIAVFQFKNPRMFYIITNNEDPRLKNRSVRYALNASLDVDRIIKQVEGGYGQRNNSIIPTDREEYNEELPNIDYNIEKANEMLQKDGWVDSDGDGIRDKIIDGRREKLSLRFFKTTSTLAQSIATILTEGAKQVGIEIVSVTKSYRDYERDHLLTGDYELAGGGSTPSASRQDPYLMWHSNSIGSGGQNYSRYSNPSADRLMETIRSTTDQTEQLDAYMKLQEIMIEDLPFVFLYRPLGRVAMDDDLIPLLSSKRPFYFPNAFKEK